jgi:hypothetical protein
MAKSQLRGNKEAKKPKKEKPKAAPAVATTATRLNDAAAKSKGAKK